MRALLLIAILVLTGCGRFDSDPAFTPYVDSFRAVMADQHVAKYAQRWNVTLKFGDPTVANTGECDQGDVQGEIIIDKGHWDSFGSDERKLIIYHELGHCVLGRKHVPTFHTENNVFVPDSIMYPDPRSVVTAYRLYPSRYEAELVAGLPTDPL